MRYGAVRIKYQHKGNGWSRSDAAVEFCRVRPLRLGLQEVQQAVFRGRLRQSTRTKRPASEKHRVGEQGGGRCADDKPERALHR